MGLGVAQWGSAPAGAPAGSAGIGARGEVPGGSGVVPRPAVFGVETCRKERDCCSFEYEPKARVGDWGKVIADNEGEADCSGNYFAFDMTLAACAN